MLCHIKLYVIILQSSHVSQIILTRRPKPKSTLLWEAMGFGGLRESSSNSHACS